MIIHNILKEKILSKRFRTPRFFSCHGFDEKKRACLLLLRSMYPKHRSVHCLRYVGRYMLRKNNKHGWGVCYLGLQQQKPKISTREGTVLNLNFGSNNLGLCMFHSNVEKKHFELYPKLMDSIFENSTNQNSFLKPKSFSLFCYQNSSICFHEIIIADTLYRKKRKTNMQIGALEKITCSYTGKELVSFPAALSIPMCALTFLSGQKCTMVWASKSVSSWKLRKNTVIGCKVTLRGRSAYVFLDKLYVYGREGILEKNNNFLNNFPFYFGVSKNKNVIELQKSARLSSSFTGFSVSID